MRWLEKKSKSAQVVEPVDDILSSLTGLMLERREDVYSRLRGYHRWDSDPNDLRYIFPDFQTLGMAVLTALSDGAMQRGELYMPSFVNLIDLERSKLGLHPLAQVILDSNLPADMYFRNMENLLADVFPKVGELFQNLEGNEVVGLAM